ncbi:MAG: hypothetical protein ACLFVD_04430 [Dehalococcoidia bacterium]
MNATQSLAVAVSQLIKRMSAEERLELMRYISWQEMEEWKATQETLSDRELMTGLKAGLKDEQEGGVTEVRL